MATAKDHMENISHILQKLADEKEDGTPTVIHRAKQFSNRL